MPNVTVGIGIPLELHIQSTLIYSVPERPLGFLGKVVKSTNKYLLKW